VPEHLRDVWPAMRLVFEDVTTLPELETSWSIDDVMDFTDGLEVVRRAEAEASRIK
jgi:hypothetical protein